MFVLNIIIAVSPCSFQITVYSQTKLPDIPPGGSVIAFASFHSILFYGLTSLSLFLKVQLFYNQLFILVNSSFW